MIRNLRGRHNDIQQSESTAGCHCSVNSASADSACCQDRTPPNSSDRQDEIDAITDRLRQACTKPAPSSAKPAPPTRKCAAIGLRFLMRCPVSQDNCCARSAGRTQASGRISGDKTALQPGIRRRSIRGHTNLSTLSAFGSGSQNGQGGTAPKRQLFLRHYTGRRSTGRRTGRRWGRWGPSCRAAR